MPDSTYLLTQYGVVLEIDTTPYGATRTWAPVCAGFDNLDEALNEQIKEYFFLCGKGFGSDYVVGMHPKLSLTGWRIVGDPAQDFIFGRKYELMAGRKTNFRYSIANADGTVSRYTFAANMSNLKSFGGTTADGAAITVDIGMDGKPAKETVAPSGTLAVSSVAGNEEGTTVLTCTPTFPDAGCKFVYDYDDTAPAATAGSVIAGWNDFVNGATYQIPAGKKITVAMINVSTYKVIVSGTATIVSGT